jgi:predicted transposase/invertase (TIGR01784 family)
MENNLELLPLTDDYIFKRVFAYKGNESVLKDFLEALLKIEIKGIKITNPEIIPYEKGEKRVIKIHKIRSMDVYIHTK